MAKDIVITPGSADITFSDTSVQTARIYESNTDLYLNATGNIVFGDGTPGNVELGNAATAVSIDFLGGGDITSSGNTLAFGIAGDIINLNVTGVTYNFPSNLVTTSDLTPYATQSYVTTTVSNLVASAPATLDTLNELAAALGDDPNFATTVSNSIGTKWTQDNTKISNWDTAYGWGNHASAGYYLASNPNGYTDDQTASEILTAIKTVDGSGSGLDADLLDGQHGSYYAPASSLSNYVAKNTSFDWTSGVLSFRSADAIESGSGDQATLEVFQDTVNADAFMQFHVGGDFAAYFGLDGSTNDFAVGGWSMGANKYKVWHSGNDGSGSGLDADMLDGQEGSYYYSPGNPPPLTADPVITLTGAVTGSGTMTNLGSVSIATTATADPTLTLTGDVTGSATFTNLGNATLTAVVADDSHNHIISNVDGLQAALDSKLNLSGGIMSGNLTISKTEPVIRLYDTDAASGTYGSIEWDSANNQGVKLAFNEFDNELPISGYGLVLGPSSTNTQFPTTGTLSFDVLGEIYAGGTTLGTLNKVFHDGYHPNADKWTTARTNTVTLTGEVTGSGSASVDGSGNWTVSLATTVDNSALNDIYVNKTGDTMTGTLNVTNSSNIVVGTYGTTDTGLLALTGSTANKQAVLKCTNGNLHMDSNAGNTMYLNYYSGTGIAFGNGATAAVAWMGADGDLWKGSADNTGERYFHDGYHPNADKWTTARTNTVTLTGDVTGSGSASVDGTGNWTVSVPAVVANDSHSHSNYMPIQQTTTYTAIPTGTWGSYNLGNGIMTQEGSVNKPDGATNGYWFIAGKRDTSNGYKGLYLNNYNGASGMFIGTNSLGTSDPIWERVWTSTTDGSGSGLDADLLDGKDKESFNPVVARYLTGAGASGRLRITLPFTTLSARMLSFTISVYGDYQQYEYRVSAYLYPTTNNWYLPKIVYAGTGTPDIQMGRDDNGYAYLSIPRYSYVGVVVHSVTIGYTGSAALAYDDWTIVNETAVGPNQVTPDISKVWHSNNDGSGSGLDADLLDGQEGSYYAPASHDHSGVYLPIAGKAADSNLLDGIDSASFLRSDATDTASGVITFSNGSNATSTASGAVRITGGLGVGYNVYANAFLRQGNTVWDAGNDGSGSGLDADLLDGQEGSYYAPNSSLGNYLPLAGGTLTGALTGTTATLSEDASINGLTVGLGGGSVSSNTAVGYQSLFSNTTGSDNSASGRNALRSNTSGSSNTASGVDALYSNTTGLSNTAYGRDALYSNTTGSDNSASGRYALYSNTSGSYNSASGRNALRSNTIGNYNSAIGSGALYFNTTGSNNTASGFDALRSNTSASNNTASGYAALYSNTFGYYNSASGAYALRSNISGNYNSASGAYALYSNSTGSYNSASGAYALYLNTTGLSNTASGSDALRSNTTGLSNTASGRDALRSNSTGSYNTAFGNGAGNLITTGSRNTILGRYNGNQGGLDIRTASNHIVLSDGDGNPRLHIDSTGATTFSGDGLFEGNVIAYSSSDKRLKDNITPINNALDKITQLGGYEFDWNGKQTVWENGKHDVGVIAQEVQAVVPEAVKERKDGYLGVDYEKLIPLLIEAIKEQQIQINELKAQVNSLKEK